MLTFLRFGKGLSAFGICHAGIPSLRDRCQLCSGMPSPPPRRSLPSSCPSMPTNGVMSRNYGGQKMLLTVSSRPILIFSPPAASYSFFPLSRNSGAKKLDGVMFPKSYLEAAFVRQWVKFASTARLTSTAPGGKSFFSRGPKHAGHWAA